MQDDAPRFGDSAPAAEGHTETHSGSHLAADLIEPGYCRLCDRRVQPTEPGRCPECGTSLAVPGTRSRSTEAARAMKAAQATKVAFEAARAGYPHMPAPSRQPATQASEPAEPNAEEEFPDYFKPPVAGRPAAPHRTAAMRLPRVAEGTAVASPDARVRTSAIIAMLAGAGVVLAVFTPWFGIPVPGNDFSGWRVTSELADNGRFLLGVWNFSRDGFSPFFSGLTCMAAGLLLAGAGLTLLYSPLIPQPATTAIRPSAAHFVRTLGWLAAAPPLANLVSFFAFPIDTAGAGIPWDFEPRYGLFLSALLALGAAIALHSGCTGSKSRVSWR